MYLSNYKFLEPEAPTLQTIQDSDVTEDTIIVQWTAPTGGAESYELTYEITSQGSSSANTITGITETCKCA